LAPRDLHERIRRRQSAPRSAAFRRRARQVPDRGPYRAAERRVRRGRLEIDDRCKRAEPEKPAWTEIAE
jgi:hypothetical protein